MKPTEAPKRLWVLTIKGLNNREKNLINLFFFNIFSLFYINLYFHLDFKICCIHMYTCILKNGNSVFLFVFCFVFLLFKKNIATHAFNFICKISFIEPQFRGVGGYTYM